MSYLTVSSTRRYGDEWIQVKCDGEGCGAVGPRVEVIVPRRGMLPDHLFKLAKTVAGFAESVRPWPSTPLSQLVRPRRRKGVAVADLCPACLYKVRILRLIDDLGGPFDRPLPDADGNLPETT
jgi:hypothetical protein